MSTELEELYQQVILDHSRRPRNVGTLEPPCNTVHGDNPSCGDEIFLHTRFDSEGKLSDIKFTGSGCAISQASASLMTMKTKGLPRAEVEKMLQDFHHLVTEEGFNPPSKLGDLALLQGVRKFPQRVKCAMLAWRALEQSLGDAPGEVTTEEPTS